MDIKGNMGIKLLGGSKKRREQGLIKLDITEVLTFPKISINQINSKKDVRNYS